MSRPDFARVLNPGSSKETGPLFIRVNWRDGRLSIAGVEGPRPNGDARGSAGQCVDALHRLDSYAAGWDAGKAAELADLWDRWHLNDLRAGCEHQRKNWDTRARVEVVHYGLTTEASGIRRKLLEIAAKHAVSGTVPDLTDTDRALLGLEDWYRDRHTPPDADSPLSGCFEVKKRETKAAGLVRPDEHPGGLLEKACERCGYRYGTKWLREQVPGDVLDRLRGLPESGRKPAWV